MAPNKSKMQFNRKGILDDKLIELYKSIITPRLVEDKMLILTKKSSTLGLKSWFNIKGDIYA